MVCSPCAPDQSFEDHPCDCDNPGGLGDLAAAFALADPAGNRARSQQARSRGTDASATTMYRRAGCRDL
jgi:hypothetical protein